MKQPTETQFAELWEFCKYFISKEDIGSGECVYQNDNVILNALEFIEGVCNIVGYSELNDDDED